MNVRRSTRLPLEELAPYLLDVPDLLAVNRGAWMIGDWYFGDFLAHTAHLRGNFRAEFEAAAFEKHLHQHGTAKHFIAGRLIVNTGTVQQVCEMRKELRTEEKAQATLRTIGPNTVNNVSFSGLQRGQQCRIVSGIIFQIGILNQHILASRMR